MALDVNVLVPRIIFVHTSLYGSSQLVLEFGLYVICEKILFHMCAVNGKRLLGWFESQHLAFWDVSQVICSISSAKVDSVTYTELVYLQIFV